MSCFYPLMIYFILKCSFQHFWDRIIKLDTIDIVRNIIYLIISSIYIFTLPVVSNLIIGCLLQFNSLNDIEVKY